MENAPPAPLPRPHPPSMVASRASSACSRPALRGSSPMLQALDLARENAALTNEVARLRQQLEELIPIAPAELTNQTRIESSSQRAAEYSSGDAVRLVVVLPRCDAVKRGWPDGRRIGLSEGEVVIDRRVAERRRPGGVRASPERRRYERRSHYLPVVGAVCLAASPGSLGLGSGGVACLRGTSPRTAPAGAEESLLGTALRGTSRARKPRIALASARRCSRPMSGAGARHGTDVA